MTTTIPDNDTRSDQEASRVAALTGKVRNTADAARTKASDAYRTARERTSTAYGSVRESASGVASTARERAGSAKRTTADGIDANPVAALVGGLALGALAAAFLPVSRRERDALGDVGRRVNDTARDAARAAKDAGRGKLDELGLKEAAKQTFGELASKAGEAARTSASAAAQTVKSS